MPLPLNLSLFLTDTILRQQVHTEIEVFKENINRILTDQQYQFKQAFGLPDPALNTTEVRYCNYSFLGYL